MYGEWTSVANDVANEPVSAREALLSSDREHWMSAMQQEMDSIYKNDVYDLVKLPEGKRALNSRWVFKKKISSNGSVLLHKVAHRSLVLTMMKHSVL